MNNRKYLLPTSAGLGLFAAMEYKYNQHINLNDINKPDTRVEFYTNSSRYLINELGNILPEPMQIIRERMVQYAALQNNGAKVQKNQHADGKKAIYYRGESFHSEAERDRAERSLLLRGRLPRICKGDHHEKFFAPIHTGYLISGIKVIKSKGYPHSPTFTSGLVSLSADYEYAKAFASSQYGLLIIAAPRDFFIPASRSVEDSKITVLSMLGNEEKLIEGNEYEFAAARLKPEDILAICRTDKNNHITSVTLNCSAMQSHDNKLIVDKIAARFSEELLASCGDPVAKEIISYFEKQHQDKSFSVVRHHNDLAPKNVIKAYQLAVDDFVNAYQTLFHQQHSLLRMYSQYSTEHDADIFIATAYWQSRAQTLDAYLLDKLPSLGDAISHYCYDDDDVKALAPEDVDVLTKQMKSHGISEHTIDIFIGSSRDAIKNQHATVDVDAMSDTSHGNKL